MWVTRRIELFIESIISRLGAIRETIEDQRQTNSNANIRQHEDEELLRFSFEKFLLEYKQAQEQNSRDNQKSYSIQKSLRNYTALAFLAASIYAAVAWWQGCTMHQTYTEIQQQTAAAECAAKAAQSEAQTAANAFKESKTQFATTLGEMQDQIKTVRWANTIAQQALEAQTRPWIGIPDTVKIGDKPSQLESAARKQHSETARISFSFKNYGKSPAMRIGAKFFLVWTNKDFHFQETKVCELASNFAPRHHAEGLTVFPEETTEPQTSDAETLNPTGRQMDFLIGCIAYTGPSGGQTYYTRLVYRVNRDKNVIQESGMNYQPISGFDLIYANAE